MTDIDKPQLLTYFRRSRLKFGFVMDVHVIRLADGIRRIVKGL